MKKQRALAKQASMSGIYSKKAFVILRLSVLNLCSHQRLGIPSTPLFVPLTLLFRESGVIY
jgi:hypothetical protein